jgi:ABC-type transporter Mla MlaB component
MLRISEQRAPGRVVLKLEGRLVGEWVREVDACWRAVTASADRGVIWVDLSDVWFVDVTARALLARMHRAGVQFLTQGCEIPEVLREISES